MKARRLGRLGWVHVPLVAVSLHAASPALADEPSSPPPEQSAQPTGADIVRLKNGGLLRGTIAELIPNDVVVIVLVSGETRRVPMAEVVYAGREANEPPAADSPAPAETQTAPTLSPQEASVPNVSFVSPERVTVFVRSADDDEYRNLCTTPCESALDAGSYNFALMRDGSTDRVEAGTATVTGNATVEAKYRSRNGLRTAGGLVGLLGGVVGGALWIAASGEEEDCSLGLTSEGSCVTVDTTSYEQLWLGRILLVSSLITGIVLIAIPDGASVKVLPATSALSGPGRRVARDILNVALTPSGAVLRGNF